MLKAVRVGLMEGLCWRDQGRWDARGLFAVEGTRRSPSCPNFPFPEHKGCALSHPASSIPSSACCCIGEHSRRGTWGYPGAGGWPGQFIVQRNYKGDTKSHTPHFV